MKVILAHPGKQHSYHVAEALKHRGLLYKYITCIYDKPDSLIMKLVHLIVRGDDVKKTDSRRCTELGDSDVMICYTLLSLCVIVLSRISHTRKLSYLLDRKIADFFGVRVAKYAIKHNVDAVVCFSMNETTCFGYLKKNAPHIKRIVDCANAPVDFMRSIYDNEIRKTGVDILRHEVPSFWNSKELENQLSGINDTHFFLAPSSFVEKGLIYCGVRPEKIKILHYGSNFSSACTHHSSLPEKIKFVYVGQVTYRKGMHILLSIFKKINRDDITLDIVGGWKHNSILYNTFKDEPNIVFWGNVPHEQVKDILMKCDVFVFPSLSEGFSLSCLEALSCALPIICSNNSGANDLIEDGINGFTFEYDDEERLFNIINTIADNKQILEELSKNALETSKYNTWTVYEDNLSMILSDWLDISDSGDILHC